LRRTAAGCRKLISEFVSLEDDLIHEGHWVTSRREHATRLLGHRPEDPKDEDSYWLRLLNVAAQETPNQAVLEQLSDPRRVPDTMHFLLDLNPMRRDDSLAKLRALVAKELAVLRPLEEALRTEIEEPARAEVADKAGLLSPEKRAPWERYERMHDSMFHRSYRGLERYEAFRSYLDPDPEPEPEPDPEPEPEPEIEEPEIKEPSVVARSPTLPLRRPGSPCRAPLGAGRGRPTVTRTAGQETLAELDPGSRGQRSQEIPAEPESVVPDASGVIQVEADPGHRQAVGDDAGRPYRAKKSGRRPARRPPRRAKIRKIRSRRPRPTLRQGTQQRHGKTRRGAGGSVGAVIGVIGRAPFGPSRRAAVPTGMMRRRSTRRPPRASPPRGRAAQTPRAVSGYQRYPRDSEAGGRLAPA